MKTSILHVGKALNKVEQKKIQAGTLGRNPCNGCPYDPVRNCCLTDEPCEATSVITGGALSSCN